MNMNRSLTEDALELLRELISTPSFSREEGPTADIISRFFERKGIAHHRMLHNVYAFNRHFDPAKPTILLNSHHDTVKPAPGYTLDPFTPVQIEDRLHGLGSNDAGGPLVSLIATFVHYYEATDLSHNLVVAATAEEEISGTNGIEYVLNAPEFLDQLQGSRINGAIVGEPTQMQMAVAEMGLMVIDAMATGRAGHAARNEGDNAIVHAIRDIEWIHAYTFDRKSDVLGPAKMTVTVIETVNKQHNVVPDKCRFVIDVRVNEMYTCEEVLDTLRKHLRSELTPRSTRLRSTRIPQDHALVQAGLALGRSWYGSPTTSDKALMNFPALKMGPGDSARSHTADEYIKPAEVAEGIEIYTRLLDKVIR